MTSHIKERLCFCGLLLATLGATAGCTGNAPESPLGDAGVPTGLGGAAAGGSLGSGGVGSGGVGSGGAGSGGTGSGGAGSGGAGSGGTGSGGTGSGGSTINPGADASADVRSDGATPGRDGGTDRGSDATVFPPSAGKPTVYLAGDSTVSTYTAAQAPQQGWGQRLQEYFTSDVIVVNRALGGRSSKSFIDEGHLNEILAVIKPGDYLFAQWGINDRSVAGPTRATDPATTFRTYLKQYIDGARAKNAIPVLVTPTPRHQFTNGVFQNGFPAYCEAIIAVGAETNTPVIDLQSKGLAYYTSIGDAKVISTIILNGSDPLHFNTEGAFQMARLVAQGVEQLNLPISQYVVASKL